VPLPNDTQKPKIFLDASALFAAVYSRTGGARMLLRLAEGDAVQLFVSSQVLSETEGALRRKAPDTLGRLALLLDRAHCQAVPDPAWEQVSVWRAIVQYLPDAAVLAAAIAAQAEYLVTLDRQHLIDNPQLMASPPLPIGTPGDCLEWLRSGLSSMARVQDDWYRLSERPESTYNTEEAL
jgi:predicted nucleic acid-binding protein